MRRTMLSMESLQEEEEEEEESDDDDDDDSDREDWEQEQAQDAALWRSVVDEASQKTYYYHVVTRESVWDKPLALCSARERADVARRKDQQRSFFAEMEGNIRSKISQGLLFGGATPLSIPSTPVGLAGDFGLSMATDAMEEPSPGQGYPRHSVDRLCRTISTMDDSVVVAQLCASSPRIASGTYSCSSPEAPSNFFLESGGGGGGDGGGGGGGGGCASPPSLAPLGPAAGRAPAASQRAPPWSKSFSTLKANDIPVLRRLEHDSSGGDSGGNEYKSTNVRARGSSEALNKGEPAATTSFSASSYAPAAVGATAAGVSPRNVSEGSGGQDRPRRHHRRQPSNGSASSSGSGNISAAGELAGVEDLSNAGWSGGVGPSSGGYRYGGVRASICGGEVASEHPAGREEAERGGGHRRSLPPSLVRRNSTSTIYLAAHDTLSDPDLDATIRCVCAVLRAHMIAAVADAREDREYRGGRGGGSGGGGGGAGSSSKAPRGGGGVGGGDRGAGVWDGERR
ncbi:unnamed protein product, partial [Hapterophycus canaliculatus]